MPHRMLLARFADPAVTGDDFAMNGRRAGVLPAAAGVAWAAAMELAITAQQGLMAPTDRLTCG